MTDANRTLWRAAVGMWLLGGVAGVLPAAALPIFAAREGLSCRTCHVDPSGGGMRNGFGFEYERARHALVPEMRWPGLPEAQPEPAPGLTVGADLRGIYYGLNQRDVAGFPDAQSTFIRMQSALYVAYAPLDRLTLYLNADLDQPLGPEAWGLVRFGPDAHAYTRLGSFRIPYGLRLDDHTLYVRRDLPGGGFELLGRGGDPRTPDTGVELGWTDRRHTVQVAITHGAGGRRDGADRNVAVTARASHDLGRLLAGVTTHLDTDGSGGSAVERRRYGVYGTLRVTDRLVLLGELHLAEDTLAGPETMTRALLGWGEADLFLGRDARLRLRYDYVDTDRDRALAAAERYAIEVDLTPLPFVTQRFAYRYVSSELGPELDELIAMWHFSF
ncbi:MAG: hypothetical protein PVF43_14975 [Candidatus Eiseniibacteriota bacterium]|jgi:hypothetical protein